MSACPTTPPLLQALEAYLCFSDSYMSAKLEHYLSFLLSAASLHELVLFADGLRHLLIAERRIWDLWTFHVEDAIEASSCGRVHEESVRTGMKPLNKQDLASAARWFRVLGKSPPVSETLLTGKGGEPRTPELKSALHRASDDCRAERFPEPAEEDIS